MDATTTDSTEYLQFDPDGLPGERWLHRRDQFDATADEEEIRDEYALPESESITVAIVDVPADVAIRIPVTHLYNSRTDNNIIVRPNGEFLSGWELSPSQKQSVTSTGELS
ncbi:hypothetical protein [Haloarcula sp. CBA1127]|uniref:hypothetical protein n=1 Tax=Haloarcula sp. CBA1127 TaxID=1765055 RepID=UPI00073E1D81|nr:hypothetical protein [Haloarcula sp. CBA1127]